MLEDEEVRGGAVSASRLLPIGSPHVLLRCDQISERAREFVQDVMRDDRLQREGGDAIWNSVYHATVPGAVRYIVLYLLPICFYGGQLFFVDSISSL